MTRAMDAVNQAIFHYRSESKAGKIYARAILNGLEEAKKVLIAHENLRRTLTGLLLLNEEDDDV